MAAENGEIKSTKSVTDPYFFKREENKINPLPMWTEFPTKLQIVIT